MTNSKVATLQGIMDTPYGQASGDLAPGGAINRTAADDYVRCYVRNWSANIERTYVFEYVSQYRGGEKSKALANAKAEDFNLEALQIRHHNGQAADILERGVKSTVVPASLEFDSKKFLVPPSKDGKKEPEWQSIPSGAMYIYFGDPDRLNSPDRVIANNERERIAAKFRYDPCIRKDARGENTNKYGFLEFKREIIEPSSLAVDADSIYAHDHIEV